MPYGGKVPYLKGEELTSKKDSKKATTLGIEITVFPKGKRLKRPKWGQVKKTM